jgi:hypothetical protein
MRTSNEYKIHVGGRIAVQSARLRRVEHGKFFVCEFDRGGGDILLEVHRF